MPPINMTPDQIRTLMRQILREELAAFMYSDRYVFGKTVQFNDGRNIQMGVSTGTKIGTTATQKLGFFGVTPAVQQAAVIAPSGGATIDSQARTAVIALINELHTLGLIG